VTFAVTGATALVLAAAGVLVYVQFGRTLDARTDAELHDRVDALTTLAASVPPEELIPDSGEPFARAYRALEAHDLDALGALLTRFPELAAARGTNGNDLLGMAGATTHLMPKAV